MKSVARLIGPVLLVAAARGIAAEAPRPPAFEAGIADAKAAMIGEPEKALRFARGAARAADAIQTPDARALALAEAQWLEGEALTRANQPDKADPVINKALAEAGRLAPGSKLVGDLMMSAATIDWTTGRVGQALAGFQEAHRLYGQLGEKRGQAKALQYIGTIYFDARDYPRMLRYYRQAEETYSGDPSLTVSALNNQGDALKEMRRFPEAIALYRRALKVAHELGPTLEVRILTNMASAEYLAGRLRAADATADRGLAMASREETGWEPFLWGVKAQAAWGRGDLASAQRFIERAFAGQPLERTTVQYRDFHDLAWQLYRRLGDKDRALDHLAAFKRLDDEMREATASANSALNAAKFDFANQELSIANLKAGQLQRDVALERSRARLQKITLWGLVAALVVALGVVAGSLFSLFSIRRSRNEVRAANDTLSVTNVALEKALKARTEFLATTSHEIRTPLNGILGMTQVLLADRAMDAQVRSRVEVVHGAGEAMRALVDDLLDVAKMEAGEASAVEEDVRPAAVLRDAVRFWGGQAEAKGLALTLEIAPDMPRVIRSDTVRLRQILFNLLSNAVKFTPAGHVTVDAKVEPDKDGEALVLRVIDTGIGIPEDRYDDIFEPFRQVDGGTSRQYGGTGLGLAICRNLAALLGGSVTVDSIVGEGSTFTLRMPLHRVAATGAGAGRTITSLAEADLLIVDPNPLTQGMLKAVLTPALALVDTSADVAAVGERLADACPDIVLIEASTLDMAALAPGIAAAVDAGAKVAVMFKPDSALTAEAIASQGALPVAKPLAAPALIKRLADQVAAPAQESREAA
ncbi:tetratricopeptide repeat-containing sensor histidine kinase [Sphingomonas jatrophae]|uniref:histidine kinase n=1 Tax=Sphingomonas jatrophae TaxID=1166337 RepID=A0A1I6K870_9SPHN|nr:ATP-binding protein [Sphingomonas jatrophae]SFR87344.1 Signal transduction histidine kinase [Sphingomonas jatrophae]